MNRIVKCCSMMALVSGITVIGGINLLHAEDKPAATSTPPQMDMSKMDPQEMMKQMAILQAPGKEHQDLMKAVGNYKLSMVMKWSPDSPEEKSEGTSKIVSILDGRFLMEETTSSMMGQSYKGIGMIGYDNTKKQYFTTWFDSMSTGPTTLYGDSKDSGKTITYAGDMDCPGMPGMKVKMRMVFTHQSDDAYLLEMYQDMGQGEFKGMTINYTRVK